MKALARGCLELLVVWAIAGGAFYAGFQGRFTPPGPFYGSLVSGLLLASAWGLIRNGLQARGQVDLIRRAQAGQRPRDGASYAAIGVAAPLGEPLLTPFQKKPCVLYSYDLSKTVSVRIKRSDGWHTETQRTVYLTGLAMAPWAVRTRGGDVRVIGFPVPDEFREEKLSATQYRSALTEHCERTSFTDVGDWEIGKLVGFASSVMAEGDGDLRQDLRFDEAADVLDVPGGLSGCDLVEQYIRVEAPLCVIGYYDATKGGLTNVIHKGGLQAIPGDAKAALKKLSGRSTSYFCIAMVLGLLGTFGSYGVLSMRENSDSIKDERNKAGVAELLAAIEAGDLTTLAVALEQGASPDARDHDGRPIVMRVTSQAMFDLLVKHHVDLDTPDSVGRTPLLASIDDGNKGLIAMLVQGSADVNQAQLGWGRTPLEAAYERSDQPLMAALVEKGAKGVFATRQSGRPIGDEAEQFTQLLRTHTEGLDRHDAQLVKSVTDDWPEDYLESVTRGVYADTKPRTWTVDSGYRDEGTATVIVSGRLKSGGTERHVVTFVLRDNAWRIRRTYWDQYYRFSF